MAEIKSQMQELHNSFITKQFLRSVWALDYKAFQGSEEERQLDERLVRWSERKDLKETSAEAAFIEVFFRDTWGYAQSGQIGAEKNFTLWPKFSIAGAGEKGGTGAADLAIGYFSKDAPTSIPQVVCEFKDIKSDLDAPQKRKGNNRSPVRQCLDYLSNARRGMFGNEPTLPTWALVTDMNEFRLYWFDRSHHQFIRFTIRPTTLFQGANLLSDSEDARFDRFLFKKLFHRDTLLIMGGRSHLAQLIAQQWVRERELENTFYAEYRKFREHLYLALLEHNGEGTTRFPGTKGKLVRLAQKILDRSIFIFFCEDMGRALGFPPQLLRDFLIDESKDRYLKPNGQNIWQKLVELFSAMNLGEPFGGTKLNAFNGGLFAVDEDLDRLHVPNHVFCQPGQGQNEAGLYAHKLTLLYFSASYSFASDWSEDLTRPPVAEAPVPELKREVSKSLGLYTLGRIFEQSITELEILEAEADGRLSINKENKRKRDGVYYTPEWVVERIVDLTLGPRLTELKRECRWPDEEDDALPTVEAIDRYSSLLKGITVLDPACGSGAFLITALRYLVDEWHSIQAIRRQVSKDFVVRDDDALIRDILQSNLYGVDINAASVEITQLALWLHTARGDKPLSSLGATIREGNSLIDSNFYKGQIDLGFYDDTQRERVNAFDWELKFPEVKARGGFDVIIGNPPYVKLQNFRRVHSDMAEFLRNGRSAVHINGYSSAKTGNFDLYLPFIEKGLSLLNERGRLGFIAPSLWAVNEYGEGLRSQVTRGRNLEGWIDFKAFQVFEEATNYTALQFFTKAPNDAIKIALAPNGVIPERPWDQPGSSLAYGHQVFGDRWLLLSGSERALTDKLYERCRLLSDPVHTENIFVGLQTSADSIYHLKRLGSRRYVCSPRGDDAPPPYEVELEDEIMKPLVSGTEAKRYVYPETDIYLLFPYQFDNQKIELITQKNMANLYPEAWKFLLSYEAILRNREAKKSQKGEILDAPFDDDSWYRFGRNQNLDKQEIVKLVVPRLVARLACSVDHKGSVYLDNVDVGGVAVAASEDPFFLAGILNAPVADYVFRRISKPFRGNYLSANKQFISPLPIPPANESQRADVASRARELQGAHTERRDLIAKLQKRLVVTRTRSRPETWLFSGLKAKKEILEGAPKQLEPDARKQWAEKEFERALAARYDEITLRLDAGVSLAASFTGGELSFSIAGITAIDRIFLDEHEGIFIVAQWKVLASTLAITENTEGKKLCNALRRLAVPDNDAVVKQIIDLERELSANDAEIRRQEAELNKVVYDLYQLTQQEISMVEGRRLT
ncbi:Eco57I restriction-modification methylase domain-containing protein [Bradyrhizobium sp.]|uniref:Eco57I restriction-modification methylase domain-containing protein n=1 Tax=Bradyrhizobium sp. TaxID=376 RepID=UPI0027356771|nr:DNA methyltransferase [Bradyrhizobium sp.]MDP3076099.1 Eco57I restriction-modification methylase domain-containing protein [Bradyrhizobium sp.]